jgi:hypothetical protein
LTLSRLSGKLYPEFCTQKMEKRLCKAVIISVLQRRIFTQKYCEIYLIFVLAIIFFISASVRYFYLKSMPKTSPISLTISSL